MVVHERRHVQPLMTPKLECEDVALPQLIRLGPLESPFGLVSRLAAFALRDKALFVQDSPNRGLRDAQTLEPRHDVPDPACAPLGMLLAKRHRLSLFDAGLALRSRH